MTLVLSHNAIRQLLALSIFVIYGLFSSPTPDSIGLAEALIALLLVALIVSSFDLRVLFVRSSTKVDFLVICALCFWLLMTVLPLVGMLRGNNLNDVIRDMIPALYAFIFLLLWTSSSMNKASIESAIILGLVFVGMAFSLRYFQVDGVNWRNVGKATMFGDMRYLPQDPAVTFAAIFSLCEAFRFLNRKNLIFCITLLLISGVCISALIGMSVRAPILLYFLVVALYATIIGNLGIRFAIALLLIVLAINGWQTIESTGGIISNKFSSVGFNSKEKEALAILAQIFQNPWIFFFGTGWGGLIETPTLSSEVRFVHNFALYYFVKAGLVGLIFAAALIYKSFFVLLGVVCKWAFAPRFKACFVNYESSVAIAILATFSSSLFLQANFKSLSFGFLMFLALRLACMVPSNAGRSAAQTSK